MSSAFFGLFTSLNRRWKRPLAIFRPHHYLHFELVPRYRSADGRISHNSHGFRGAEFNLEKAEGFLRIVCLGESTTYGSTTYGDGVSDQETYPACLQQKLVSSGYPVELINAGVPSYTSSEVLLNYIFKIEPLKPDWIVYYFTINDIRPRQIGPISRDYREFCRLWSARPKLRSVREILTYFRYRKSINYRVRNLLHVNHSKNNILQTDGRVFRANVRDLLTLATAHSCRVLVVCPRYRNLTGNTDSDLQADDPMSRAVAEHRAIAFELAKEFGQPSLDMVPLMPKPPWSGVEASDTYVDSVHMTARGYSLFAEHIAKVLLAYISIEYGSPQSKSGRT
jgi:lysophospholipase L1-like esterase